MSIINPSYMNAYQKALVAAVKTAYVSKEYKPRSFEFHKVTLNESGYNVYIRACPTNSEYHQTLLNFRYTKFPYCCGMGTLFDLSFLTLPKTKANKLAKELKKFFVGTLGAGGKGWSSLIYVVSEQEKGFQRPMLEAMGFKEIDTTISRGTRHRLTTFSLDIRTPSEARAAKTEYNDRFGDASPYTLGQGRGEL